MYFQEAIAGSEELIFVMRNMGERSAYYKALKSGEGIEDAKKELLSKAEVFFKDYNATIGKNIFEAVLSLYFHDVPSEFHPPVFNGMGKNLKGDFSKLADMAFGKGSWWLSYQNFEERLNKITSLKKLEKDLFFMLHVRI